MRSNIAIEKIRESLQDLSMKSILSAQSVMQELGRDTKFLEQMKLEVGDSGKSLELYRDNTKGFVLLVYSEIQGTYRIPHNHGDAWVIYSVAAGNVEMGNYFKSVQSNMKPQLILKNREILSTGDARIYYPGEIHDTRCVSESALILRLTSSDLKEEERQGRMQRFQI